MSFFGLFGSTPKQSSKKLIKIYKDETCKDYFNQLIIEDNTQCYKILDQIDTQVIQGEDVYYLIRVGPKNPPSHYMFKRKKINHLANSQQIGTNCKNYENHPTIIGIICNIQGNQITNTARNATVPSQNMESQYLEQFTCQLDTKEHSYRQGTLLKKNKNNQFRERLFKLQKDTLIFEKQEKNKLIKKSCISLDSMEIEKPQEKSLVFLIKCDQKVYYIKAQSRTDYDGWIYSLHNQIIKWKEIKLLLDYDKKIENFSLQKVEKIKTISMQQKSIKQLLQSNNYITTQFEKFLVNQANQLDIELFQFLKLCIEVDQFQGSQKKIQERDYSLSNLQQRIYQHSYFQGFENKQLNPTKQEIIRYFDETLFPIFQKTTDQHQLLLDYSIYQYKQHMSFPLPDSSSFYQDPLIDSQIKQE